MTIWTKICGLTDTTAVASAIDAGVDAVGFVFAKSPREVSIAQAILLAGIARGHATIVAVMKHPDPAYAAEMQARVQPDWLQSDAEDFANIHLLPGVRPLPVYRDSTAIDTGGMPNRFLFEGANSGAGETADWGQAADLAKGRNMVLAGGLGPDNVAAAITAVRPWGVDVSSGVEASPGQKDPVRMQAFLEAARAAA
ncbi:MAG: phosphoribosylanthranilate isomerase [Woeseiaceae bacterium]